MLILPIPGFPGYYATDDGRVISFRSSRVVPFKGRRAELVDDGRELRQFDRRTRTGATSPYLSVCLSKDGRRVNAYVHHLVALAFLGPRPLGAHVCHGPGGSRDNSVGNLRYDSREANLAERNLPTGDAWHAARGAFDDLLEVGT